MNPSPMTMTALCCFIFFFGLYQTVPIFIAAVTSYTLLMGTGLLTRLSYNPPKPEEAPRDSQLEMQNPINNATSTKAYEQGLYRGKQKNSELLEQYVPPKV